MALTAFLPACPQLARHDRLSTFLKTKAGPSVYWCPKQHSHITLRLHEQQRQELQQWKVRGQGLVACGVCA